MIDNRIERAEQAAQVIIQGKSLIDKALLERTQFTGYKYFADDLSIRLPLFLFSNEYKNGGLSESAIIAYSVMFNTLYENILSDRKTYVEVGKTEWPEEIKELKENGLIHTEKADSSGKRKVHFYNFID